MLLIRNAELLQELVWYQRGSGGYDNAIERAHGFPSLSAISTPTKRFIAEFAKQLLGSFVEST